MLQVALIVNQHPNVLMVLQRIMLTLQKPTAHQLVPGGERVLPPIHGVRQAAGIIPTRLTLAQVTLVLVLVIVVALVRLYRR